MGSSFRAFLKTRRATQTHTDPVHLGSQFSQYFYIVIRLKNRAEGGENARDVERPVVAPSLRAATTTTLSTASSREWLAQSGGRSERERERWKRRRHATAVPTRTKARGSLAAAAARARFALWRRDFYWDWKCRMRFLGFVRALDR